jgi:hypothetical protein
LLSAIASAPSTLSVCFLPTWDEREWSAMLERDGPFFAEWIGFARENAGVLARLEDLFDEPCPGTVDGSVAFADDGSGFVFLANPDFEPHLVSVPRLPAGSALVELQPEPGRRWLPDEVVLEPHDVAVFRVEQRRGLSTPALYGAAGEADASGAIVAARGPVGAEANVVVDFGAGERHTRIAFAGDGVTRTLGPWREEEWLVTEWAPGRALPTLLVQIAPPLPAEGFELLQPWSDPGRLRLFVELLDPQAATVRMRVDGEEVEVSRAYVGTWEDIKDPERLGLENNLLGHYVDLHDRLLSATDLDRPWRIELQLDGVAEGHWRGVHVAELPRRITSSFAEV